MMERYLHGLLGLSLLIFACAKDIHVMPGSNDNDTDTVETNIDTALRSLSPYPFGAAVNIGLLKNNTNYRDLVIREFNSLTPENAMKLHFLRRESSAFDWADADYLVDFAEEHGMRVHGHTLIWYKNIPDWLADFEGDSAAWEAVFKTHIQTVVGRYKGRVGSWDVVNEALDNDGHGLRESIWLEKLGPGYIGRAFEYAHEADPDALLFYNDYGNEYGPTKRNAIIDLVNGLKAAGVPIHGVGMQMHTRYNREDHFHTAAIESTAAATGLLVHIAELDIAMNPANDPSLTFTAELAERQKQAYQHIVSTFTGLPQAQRFGITTWNVTDADSWIPGTYNRPDWPLPFDSAYARKPAYGGILAGFDD